MSSFNVEATNCIENTNSNIPYYKNMDTIGDSITWQGEGQYFRCLLRDYGLQYNFVGNNVDRFSFKHDGEGGNTSAQVIKRLNTIPVSDVYFLLIGINDILQNVPINITLNNIKKIGNSLYEKNNNARIYISTLLPIAYKQNTQVQKLNNLLLSSNFMCTNCVVIDVGGDFYRLGNWSSFLIEGIHPNLNGYNALSKIIAAYLA